ncbi:MAG: phosphate regulon sensor histidine kinase PhoR [Rhodocyclaceae bacterium]|nr:phosphate regulon sensor histidine kinase PhoR [Rhodocyclaceae bacterium]
MASLAIGVVQGLVWGMGSFCLLLLLLGVYHTRNLAAFARWTRQPIGSPVPRASGLWDFLFSDLARRARASEEKRQRLSASLEQFRDASHAMPDGVIYLSAANTIEWVNQRAEEQLGLDGKRDVGAPITNLVREPDFVAFLVGGEFGQPLSFHSRRHQQLTLQIQVIPFGDGQKLLLSRDVTQLERLERMRRDFVANVSHELRTPLTVVTGFLETMEDGLEDFEPDQLRHFLSLASNEAARMRQLIEDLLSLSALETGAPDPVQEEVGVAGLLAEIAEQARLLSAGRHRVTMTVDGNGHLLGCRKELYSAFLNLVTNAVRYTPAGGEIALSWQRRPDGAVFAVRDNGIGIAAEDIPRLTERFYRVDRGRSRETGGTGLGLAIVKHVLTRHQGELLIESEPGKGSSFSARFPARRVKS